jgi:hypothetical protein
MAHNLRQHRSFLQYQLEWPQTSVVSTGKTNMYFRILVKSEESFIQSGGSLAINGISSLRSID